MLAPAKINLALHVTGQRLDGYHLIESLVVFADFGDEVSVSDASADGFACFGPYVAPDLDGPGNLCLRAREILRDAFPESLRSPGAMPHERTPPHPAASRPPSPREGEEEGAKSPTSSPSRGEGGRAERRPGEGSIEVSFDSPARTPVHIDLNKRLPVASGVGGGSSDAASTLKLLSAHWRLPIDDKQLTRIATPLGADLPMCIVATPLIARGVGDQIERLETFPELHLVLANPAVAVATPDVFRQVDNKTNPPLPPLPSQMDAVSVLVWLKSTRNDLQTPAIAVAPQIADCLSALDKTGALFVRMSGSGATCFGIYPDKHAAALAAQDILRQHPGWFVVSTRTGGTGG